MTIVNILGAVFALGFGVFMFIYGGYDDSPGGQLLGVVLAVGGIVGLIKIWRSTR
jgi:hypothetical protein